MNVFWNNNIAAVTFELTGITGSNVSTPAVESTPTQSVTMDQEPMMDEEPSMSDVSSQPACGQGTVLKNGVCVVEFYDLGIDSTPDSLFPNNWISTHANGIVYLYPIDYVKERIYFLKLNKQCLPLTLQKIYLLN